MTEASTEIERLEARIDALRDEIESSRKAILISRIAVFAGAAVTLAAFVGFVTSTPVFFLAISACIAGLIGMGSNRTTRNQAHAELARCTAERNGLIDELDLRPLD